ncbi:protein Z-dependent protease inhibitor isoform X2 [Patagioenas fasciata]|uniref:protein Z-dependent protease inhibitor isoform X2 n=1 Tax=Patagioenas fasciata TaxID=372321 RepID=UPI003A998BCC
MKTGIYLLVLSEICVEISKAGIKIKNPQKEKENHFWERNNNVNIAKEWHNDKNMSKPFEEQGLEEFTLYNFTEKTANFGFNLYRKIAMTHDNNVIISPLSVSTLMTAYMLAAKGETRRQIAKGLNLHALKDRVDRHHLPALFKQLKDNITMNDELLVQGKWVYPFNSKFTETETFHINKYRSVQVPMMFKSDKLNSTFDENLRCTVIKLPYKGKAHMLIVIPEKEGDYISLEDHLTTELVESWLGNMKTRKVDISFPKFKLEQKYKLKKLLHTLGIKNLFTRTADLGHLTDQGYVAVSQVVQKAVIEVNEEGTEATAASGSEITAFTVPPVVKVDRPFLFMIFEETFKTLLFIGRVVDPTDI